ncbi:MAG: CRISPR-associated endonuclease Cas2 [Thermoplasmata archaeon]
MKLLRVLYVAYDIKSNDLRSRLARKLLYYGLSRVQLSVFTGTVETREKAEILDEVENMELGEDDKVYVIDLCSRCAKNVIVIGKESDEREHLII